MCVCTFVDTIERLRLDLFDAPAHMALPGSVQDTRYLYCYIRLSSQPKTLPCDQHTRVPGQYMNVAAACFTSLSVTSACSSSYAGCHMAQTLFSQSESALDCSKKRKKKVVGWSLFLSLSLGHRYGRFCRGCIVQVVGGRRQQQPADPIDARSMLLIFLLLPSF